MGRVRWGSGGGGSRVVVRGKETDVDGLGMRRSEAEERG